MKANSYLLILVLALTLGACEEETGSKPTVATTPVDLFTFTSAEVGGNVTSAGVSSVSDRGVYWGSSADPQTKGTKLSIGSGTGVFSAQIDVLTEKTKYYIQAFATNAEGTGFGEVVSFTTGGNDGIFTDPRNGRSYSFKNIGTQTWMVKNLDYLPSVSPSTLDSETESKYYVYDYEGIDVTAAKSSSNYLTYGVLYNYKAAVGACPGGWHLPSDAEWKTLELFLGVDPADIDIEGDRSSGLVGKQLKLNSGWGTGSNGTNASGFSALPAGFTFPGGGFGSSGNMAQFWTATESEASMAWTRILYGAGVGVERRDAYKTRGYSVRCIKDK